MFEPIQNVEEALFFIFVCGSQFFADDDQDDHWNGNNSNNRDAEPHKHVFE